MAFLMAFVSQFLGDGHGGILQFFALVKGVVDVHEVNVLVAVQGVEQAGAEEVMGDVQGGLIQPGEEL